MLKSQQVSLGLIVKQYSCVHRTFASKALKAVAIHCATESVNTPQTHRSYRDVKLLTRRLKLADIKKCSRRYLFAISALTDNR